MRKGIKKGSQAAIDSQHARVENRPLVLTNKGEEMLPKEGARKGKMGRKKIPSFDDKGDPKRAKQRSSTELIRGARLALAERVINELTRKQANRNDDRVKGQKLRGKKPETKRQINARKKAEMYGGGQLEGNQAADVARGREEGTPRYQKKKKSSTWDTMMGPLGQHPKDRKPLPKKK